MKSSKSNAQVYLMINDQAPFDRPQKVVLLINVALPEDASTVRFSGCNSGKSITVDAEKHGSRALIVVTPVFFHPEPCYVAVVSRKTNLQICEYPHKFLFTSNLMRMRELFTQVVDPVDFMCAASHVTPRKLHSLDAELERMFKQKQPVNFSLLCDDVENDYEEAYHSCEEFPTLLHFAARYGLWKLCYALIQCHGGHKALNLRNKDGLEPDMLAKKYGHDELYCALEETKSNFSCSSVSRDEGIYEPFKSMYENPRDLYNDPRSIKGEQDYVVMSDPYETYVPLVDVKRNTGDDPLVIKEIVKRLEKVLSLPQREIKENLQFVLLFAKTKLGDLVTEESTYACMKKSSDQEPVYGNVARDPQSEPDIQKPPTPAPRGSSETPIPAPRPPSLKSRKGREVVKDEQNNECDWKYNGTSVESPYMAMNNAPASQDRPPIIPRGVSQEY